MELFMSRNMPCPCGSGKKYKSCCIGSLNKEQESYFALLHKQWTLKDKLSKWMKHKILIDSEFGKLIYNEFEYFKREKEEAFMDFLFYEFKYKGESILKIVLEENPKLFDSIEIEIMTSWLNTTFSSLFEIIESNEEKWQILLKDIFSGKEYHITDKKGSSLFIKGDIVFSRIQKLFSNYHLSGVGSNYPRDLLSQLNAFIHDQAKIKNMTEYEFMNNSKMLAEFKPMKKNFIFNDGEEVTICEKIYSYNLKEIERILDNFSNDKRFIIQFVDFPKKGFKKAKIAFIAKKGVAHEEGKDAVDFKNYIIDEFGNQVEVSAGISITPTKAILFTQSKRIADEIHEFMENIGFILKKETFESIDEMLEKVKEMPSNKLEPKPRWKIEAEIEFKEKYYRDWCKQRIPLLGNITPKEAVKTDKGRELLKDMLFDLENEEEHDKRDGKFTISAVDIIRKELDFYDKK